MGESCWKPDRGSWVTAYLTMGPSGGGFFRIWLLSTASGFGASTTALHTFSASGCDFEKVPGQRSRVVCETLPLVQQ